VRAHVIAVNDGVDDGFAQSLFRIFHVVLAVNAFIRDVGKQIFDPQHFNRLVHLIKEVALNIVRADQIGGADKFADLDIGGDVKFLRVFSKKQNGGTTQFAFFQKV